MQKLIFSIVAVCLFFPVLALADSDDCYRSAECFDSPWRAMTYSCKKGEKTFLTKLFRRKGDYGGDQIFGQLKVGKKEIPLKLSLSVRGTKVLQGEGELSLSDFQTSTEHRILYTKTASKVGKEQDGRVTMPALLTGKSGSCSIKVPMNMENSKAHMDLLYKQAKEDIILDGKIKACEKEASTKLAKSAYLRNYICVIDQCDKIAKRAMRSEENAGRRSGFVNKLTLASYGYYLERSSRVRKTLGGALSGLGVKATCPRATPENNVNLWGLKDGSSAICRGSSSASAIASATCLKEIYSTKNGLAFFYAVGLVDVAAVVKGSGMIASTGDIKSAAKGLLVKSGASRMQVNNQDTSNLDPDELAAIEAAQEQMRNPQPWVFSERVSAGKEMVVHLYKTQKELKDDFEKGGESFAKGDYKKVIELIEPVFVNNHEVDKSQVMLGFSYAMRGQYKKALSHLIAADAAKEDPVRKYLLGVAYFMGGKVAKFKSTMEALLSMDAVEDYHYSTYAQLLSELGKGKSAIKVYKRGKKKFADSVKLLGTRPQIYYNLAKKQKAFKMWQKLYVDHPKDGALLNAYAYALALEKKELGKAEKLIQQALEVSPEHKVYVGTYARILFEKGSYSEALSRAEVAVEHAPNQFDLLRDTGMILAALGRKTEASSYYNRAIASTRLKKKRAEVRKLRSDLPAPAGK